MTRLAVLGAPIGHSRSPALHRAAYRVLGLDWSYEAIEVTGENLPDFVLGLGPEWRGLSLTMPLKRDVQPLLDEADEVATLTGSVNTVLLEAGRRRGFNTDVAGLVRSLDRSGVRTVRTGFIVGAGATASSALVALGELGARQVDVFARTPERAAPLAAVGERMGAAVRVRSLEEIGASGGGPPDVVISTLPGGAVTGVTVDESVRAASVLVEVAYDPWPSALAEQWLAVDGRVVDGLDMLVEQALVQVRIFVGGEPDVPVEDERTVLAAMRASVAR